MERYGPQGGNTSNNTSSQGAPHHDNAKIFVGGLSWQTTEETLRYHFEQYGEVVSVEVMRDRNTGDPRGFAFVVFREDSTVELVMQNLPHEINHKVVDVKRAQARGAAPPSIHHGPMGGGGGGDGHSIKNEDGDRGDSGGGKGGGQHDRIQPGGTKEMTPEQLQNKVFVGGLPLHITKDQLREFFMQFGNVVDAIVMMDPTQSRSRGFGFVTFENGSGGAQKALQAQPLYIESKYVEIKLATPKGDSQQGGGTGGGGNRKAGGFPPNSNAGLRNVNSATSSTQPKGEFSGLAASYGRNGWKAGYGTMAFGSAGWAVEGWESNNTPEYSGFSFAMLEEESSTKRKKRSSSTTSSKRSSSKDPKRQKT